MKKKYILIFIVSLIFMFSSCDEKVKEDVKTINFEGIEFQDEYYPDELFDGMTFNYVVNDISTSVTLNESMITNIPSSYDNEKYTFNISYEGINTSLTLNIVNRETYTNGLVFSLDGDGYTVIRYNGTDKDVTIPSTYNHKPVLKIEDNVFEEKEITIVRLNDNLTTIGDEAFINSTIEQILFPLSLTYIGESAFYGCSNLKDIYLSNDIEHLGNYAFYNTTIFTIENDKIKSSWSKDFYNSKTSYFHYGVKPENYIYNDEERYIIDNNELIYVSYHGTSETVSVSDEIESRYITAIGDAAFAGCAHVTSITLGNHIKSIGIHAFSNTNIEEMTLPESLEELGIYAFSYCLSLKEITFNEGLKKVSESCFSADESLVTVNFSSTIETIGDYCFQNCYAIKDTYIPASVTYVGINAFYANKANTFYLDMTEIPSTWNSAWNPSSRPVHFKEQ